LRTILCTDRNNEPPSDGKLLKKPWWHGQWRGGDQNDVKGCRVRPSQSTVSHSLMNVVSQRLEVFVSDLGKLRKILDAVRFGAQLR
jgi:hypothetical protein